MLVTFFCAVAGGLTAAAIGCGSTCGSGCPPIVFDIVATQGENLNIATALLTGAACPPQLTGCRGDTAGNTCVHLSIVASQPGSCQLDLTFADGRAPVTVQTAFDVETHQGCCRGLPVIGPPSFTVPPLNSVPGVDAGPDGPDAQDAAGADTIDAPTGDAAMSMSAD